MTVETKSLRIECLTCKATGLERIGKTQKAVECFICEGSGAIDYTYTPFTERVVTEEVIRVFPYTNYTVSPVMRRAPDTGKDLGAMPYEVWQALPLGKANLLEKSDAKARREMLELKGHMPFGISLHAGTQPLRVVCKSCSGTGLFIGNMELTGAAVPCIFCLGTGSVGIWYTAFHKRWPIGNITHVFPYTAHSAVRRHQGTPEFGTPYAIWQAQGCRKGDEPRTCACPVEIYGEACQVFGASAMRDDTDWCFQIESRRKRWGRSISTCKAYPYKSTCWYGFDAADDTERTRAYSDINTKLYLNRPR